MNKLFEKADEYLKESDWRDLTIIKFCLFSVGVLVGVLIPAKHKEKTGAFSAGVFSVTYVILMQKFIKILFRKEG